jgi:hypothetical protein
MKTPRFECIPYGESKDLANASSFSEDDEDRLMLKSLDYKLRARKAYASMSEAFKIEKKKAHRVLAEQPLMDGGAC